MEEEWIILDKRKTVLESMLQDVFFFALLILCIYISRENNWWTFFTGFVFIVTLYGKGLYYLKKNKHVFTSKKDLRKWVDSLDE
jgi:Na+-translocating ferredoxin:NAD+ oxidoreductase RnfD subunit